MFFTFAVHWELTKCEDAMGYSCEIEEITSLLEAISFNLKGRRQDLRTTYERALEILPKNEELEQKYAILLFEEKEFEAALKMLRRHTITNLRSKELFLNMQTQLIDRWHFPMVNDKTRNETYFKALNGVIKNDDVGKSDPLITLRK